MNRRANLTTGDILSAAGLVMAAIGILVQIFSGVASTPIPVGAIVMLLLAGLIFVRLWQWAATVGAVIGGLITIGAFIAPGLTTRLGNPAELGPFVGTVLQLLGLATAIIFGIIATIQHYKARNNQFVATQADKQ